ncbi:hypothetical protein H9P43_008167 [Blastocladiella emersonii ATCC 22665]|nr:hypothetical protein H9P43_008167 [Blastocladiella emersonii ATCC 22665]
MNGFANLSINANGANKRSVVVPVIGTTQAGKSSLVRFLREYAGESVESAERDELIIGDGINSATQRSQRYTLRIPRREVLLTPRKEQQQKKTTVSSSAAKTSSTKTSSSSSTSTSSTSSKTSSTCSSASTCSGAAAAAAVSAEDALAIKLAREALAVDAAEASAAGRDEQARSLYQLLAELERNTAEDIAAHKAECTGAATAATSTTTTTKQQTATATKTTSAAAAAAAKKAAELEFIERLEDALEDRAFDLRLASFGADEEVADEEDVVKEEKTEFSFEAKRETVEPRIVLDIIDTPGLYDSNGLFNPLTDFEHLSGVFEQVQRAGHVSALVYVVNAERPMDASALNALTTYLTSFREVCTNLVVVHSSYDVRRTLQRAKVSGFRGLFDLGPRADEFDRHLAQLGFGDFRAIHVPMNNLALAGARAGIRAVSYEAANHLIDVLEQLATVPVAPLKAVTLVKPRLVQDLEAELELVLSARLEALRREVIAERVREIEVAAAAEKLASLRAELMRVDSVLGRLDTEILVEFAARTAKPVVLAAPAVAYYEEVLGASPYEWTVAGRTLYPATASVLGWSKLLPAAAATTTTTEVTRKASSSLFGGYSSASTVTTTKTQRIPAALATIAVESAAFPIREVREILPSFPVAIRRRVTGDRRFELVVESAYASLAGAAFADKIVAKLYTYRRDMYAREIAELRARRAALIEELTIRKSAVVAMLQPMAERRLSYIQFEARAAAVTRALAAVKAERVPVEFFLGARDLYREIAVKAFVAPRNAIAFHGAAGVAQAAFTIDRAAMEPRLLESLAQQYEEFFVSH